MHSAITVSLLLAALTFPLTSTAQPQSRVPSHEELLKRNQTSTPTGNIPKLTAGICERGKTCSASLLWKMESGSPSLRKTLEQSFNTAYCQTGSTWENMAERYPRMRTHMVTCFTAWLEADCDYYTGKRSITELPGCKKIANLE